MAFQMGYIQVYTGELLANTAFGMALRASGAGYNVCVYNFCNTDLSAIDSSLNGICVKNVDRPPPELPKELNMAFLFGCDSIEEGELIEFLKNKPENIEIVLFGKNFPKEVHHIADLISSIDEIILS